MQGILKTYSGLLTSVSHVLDPAIVVAVALGFHAYGLVEPFDLAKIFAVFGAALTLLVFPFFGLYRSRRGESFATEAKALVWAWLVVGVGVNAFVFLLATDPERAILWPYGLFQLPGFWWWALGALAGILGARFAIRQALWALRRRGYNTRTVAVVGAGTLAQRLVQVIQGDPWMGMRLVGTFAPWEEGGGGGETQALVALARRGEVDLVYVALPMDGFAAAQDLVKALSDTTVSVYLVPDLAISDLMSARWVNIGELPAVAVFETPFLGADGWLKRVEDIVLSSVILALIALPMAVIALGVKLSSPGPVLFKQRRYGLDGREIVVWKFRTMTVCEDGQAVPQARRGDARITRFGAFLRRTSLDELPQFVNVLQGRMSIVGPRPHAVAHNEEYRGLIPGYMLRHKVKPGITGWAQVNGWRGETDTLEKMRKRVEFDLQYIREWSLWLDLKIIFITVWKGFVHENAY